MDSVSCISITPLKGGVYVQLCNFCCLNCTLSCICNLFKNNGLMVKLQVRVACATRLLSCATFKGKVADIMQLCNSLFYNYILSKSSPFSVKVTVLPFSVKKPFLISLFFCFVIVSGLKPNNSAQCF